jgi:cohesin loading factor subunit SCC2
LAAVKNLLDKVIYPFVEANSDVHGRSTPRVRQFIHHSTGQSSLILLQVAKAADAPAQSRREVVSEIFQTLCSVFPRIDMLVSRSHVAMSDSIIIQAVYIAIGPFFVVEFGLEGNKAAKEKTASLVLNALGGSVALRGLRLAALSLIRTVRIQLQHQHDGI